MATTTTAKISSTTSRKNPCVQLNYGALSTPNCSNELLGVASLSKPTPDVATINHSMALAEPRPFLSPNESLKHPKKEGAVVSSSNASEHGLKGVSHWAPPGVHRKHSHKIAHDVSLPGSCLNPPQKQPSTQELASTKRSSKSSNLTKPADSTSINHVLVEASRRDIASNGFASSGLSSPSESSMPCIKCPMDTMKITCNEGLGLGNGHLTSQPSPSHCQNTDNGFCSGNQMYSEAKDSFVTAKVSDGTGSVGNSIGSAKISDPRGDLVESGKSSICRGSSGSDISDESSSSSFSSGVNKPHKGNDSRWDAIQAVRSRDGVLGLNHFRLLKRLGCGDIGSVYLSELSGTRSYFAMKVMDKGALAGRKKLLRAQTEREILQSLDHPFLPTLYTHFETDKFSCLVMEFCPGGDLHALRQRQPGKYFPEQAARFYVAEVLLALEYLHMLGIIYRDLKPENVLVRDDGHIMLSDFDLSLRCAVSPTLVKSSNINMDASKNSAYCVQPSCIEPTCVIQPSCIQPTCFAPRFFSTRSKKEKKVKSKNELFNQVSPLPELVAEPTNARSMSFVGTHEYLAPEIIKGEGHGSAVDWWTFGIFLYELLFGKTPFKGSGNRATLFNVVGQPLRFPESPSVSFAARDLIRGLLVKEPQHRIAYRRGATEVKQHPFFQSINWALIRCTSPPDVPKPFERDFPARTETPTAAAASESENASLGVDVKPSGNYLEIDFF